MKNGIDTRICALAAVCALALLLAPGVSRAETAEPTPAADATPAPSPAAEEMLKAMREKGILSQEEYEDIYRRQARYEEKAREEEGIPGWMKNWTFGGDLRFRYDRQEFKDNVNQLDHTETPTRDRGRIRLRIGAEKLLSENFTLGFRFGTSQSFSWGKSNAVIAGETGFGMDTPGDPRSENVTLGNYFSEKAFFLDRAYLTWHPDFAPTFAATVGKFENPFVSKYFKGDDMVWDNDINPEGVKLEYRFDFLPEALWTDLAAGFFVLNEVGTVTLGPPPTGTDRVFPEPDGADPYMYGFQGGLNGRPIEWMQTGARVSYYDYENLDGNFVVAMMALGNSGSAVSRNPLYSLLPVPTSTSKSEGRVQQVVGDAYMTFTPWGENYAITPWGQVSTLLTASNEDIGWSAGVDLGNADLLKISFQWTSLPRNGTVSLFTDSDFLEGQTNIQGWMITLERKLTSFLRLRTAFMKTNIKQNDCSDPFSPGNLGLTCDLNEAVPDLRGSRKTTRDVQRYQADLIVDF